MTRADLTVTVATLVACSLTPAFLWLMWGAS